MSAPISDSQGRGLVLNLMRFSTRDGPGIRTTVFLKGCPLACLWCHNPESQSFQPELMFRPNLCIGCEACVAACPRGAIQMAAGRPVTDRALCNRCGACALACVTDAREIVGKTMTTAEVLAEVIRDTPFYDETGGGVTFSGGEALAQPAFLLSLLRACRESGLRTALDTTAHAAWRTLEAVRPYVDLFLIDLKTADPELHRLNTGVSNETLLRNLAALAAAGHAIVLRVPLVPGVNADPAELERMAALAAGLPPGPDGRPAVQWVEILPYHASGAEKYRRLGKTYTLESTPPPTDEQIEAALAIFQNHGLIAKRGG